MAQQTRNPTKKMLDAAERLRGYRRLELSTLFSFFFQTFLGVEEMKEKENWVLWNPIFSYADEDKNSLERESGTGRYIVDDEIVGGSHGNGWW